MSPALPLPPAFNRLAWSNLAAQSAEQMGLAAAPIVAVLDFGAGAGETGLLQTAQTLPFLLLAITAGVLADRMSRRKLMACAEALRAASRVPHPGRGDPVIARDTTGAPAAGGRSHLMQRRKCTGTGA